MKAGITRDPDAGQGNGIAGTMRIATKSWGLFEITSGQTQIVVRTNQTDGSPTSRVYTRKESLQGTVVYAELRTDKQFDLAEALGVDGKPHDPGDIIEMHYETKAGAALSLKLSDESTGFGSRLAGRQLRTKCMNLLRAEPTKPLLLDWTGVLLVSSSYADELVGKLFVELGPLAFSARIRNLGMDSLVRGLVDKAIMQRAAQVANGSTVA